MCIQTWLIRTSLFLLKWSPSVWILLPAKRKVAASFEDPKEEKAQGAAKIQGLGRAAQALSQWEPRMHKKYGIDHNEASITALVKVSACKYGRLTQLLFHTACVCSLYC